MISRWNTGLLILSHIEESTGAVGLQILFLGVQNSYPRRSVPVHFVFFRSLQKLPGIFLILTVEMTELFQLKSDRSFHGVRGSQ